MSMNWFGLGLLAALIICTFLYDTFKQNKKMNLIGGIRSKYPLLINHLLNSDSRSQVLKEDNLSILIGVKGTGVSTTFHLEESYGVLYVNYRTVSNLFPEQKLQWKFQEGVSQEKMMEKMGVDLDTLMNNLF